MTTAEVPAAAKALNLRIRGFLFELREIDGRLSLRAPHLQGYGAVYADFTDAESRRRVQGGKKQLLAKAVGLHKYPHPHVLDCTGGMGRDAFTLASLGATVTLLERSLPIARLLADAQHRATGEDISRAAAERMTVIEANAHSFLAAANEPETLARWDVIYLDPMYPEDGKSALPGKEMQLLRDLTGGDEDADALLQLARRCARNRVVVKRPAKAPWLAGEKPGLEFKGTQARFDVYWPLAAALQAGTTESGAAQSQAAEHAAVQGEATLLEAPDATYDDTGAEPEEASTQDTAPAVADYQAASAPAH